MRVALAEAYAGVGRRRESLTEAERVLEGAAASPVATATTAFMAGGAEILARVGEHDDALAILERLLGMPAGREASVALLRVDPAWDPLRRDPRFEQMLARFDTGAASSRR